MTEPQKNLTQDLRRIADEIRLKIHLASMDAKTAWASLEPRVTEFERTVDRTAKNAADDLDQLAAKLHTELENLRERVFGK
jgi:hypothetical protein